MGRKGIIRRGDVFWVSAKEIEIYSPWAPEGSQFRGKDGQPSNSSVIRGHRPAIVVSADDLNRYSSVVEVVFTTSSPKMQLPSHVLITSTSRPSTALCEQPMAVSTNELGAYICHLTDAEMVDIDSALYYSMGLSSRVNDNDDNTWRARYETMHRAYSEMLIHVMRIMDSNMRKASPYPVAIIDRKGRKERSKDCE